MTDADIGVADTVSTGPAAYADHNEHDHKALVEAVASGRITAEPDL